MITQINFTLKEIVNITSGRPVSLTAEESTVGISTDSRTIKRGEVFVAIKGEHFDGSNFIEDAKRKGAIAAVLPEGFKTEIHNLPLIKVKDTKVALGKVAKAHRDRFNIPVIAITGSNGKTTTKDMIANILSQRYKILKTEETNNNKVGVALTLLKLRDEDLAIIEIGSNSQGEIKYHSTVVRPSLGIITNIGPSHLEGLSDISGVYEEKIALVESLSNEGIWIKNSDDRMLSRNPSARIKVLQYGIVKEGVDFRAQDIRQRKDGIEFVLNGKFRFFIPVFGIHNVYNALAAIAASSTFEDIELMQKALSHFKGPHMRMEVIDKDGLTIIDDSYNSNPLSFRCAVSTLEDYPSSGRRIVVAADMLELGKESERLHYESGQFLAERKVNLLITFGELSSNMAEGAIDKGMDKKDVVICKDKSDIVPFLKGLITNGDVILIKGSRGMKMEEVVNNLQGN